MFDDNVALLFGLQILYLLNLSTQLYLMGFFTGVLPVCLLVSDVSAYWSSNECIFLEKSLITRMHSGVNSLKVCSVLIVMSFHALTREYTVLTSKSVPAFLCALQSEMRRLQEWRINV